MRKSCTELCGFWRVVEVVAEVDVVGVKVEGCHVSLYARSVVVDRAVNLVKLLLAAVLDEYFACPPTLKAPQCLPSTEFHPFL